MSLINRLKEIQSQLQLDLCIGELMQICIHQKDNSSKPVNHRLTLKAKKEVHAYRGHIYVLYMPKVKSNIRRFQAQDFL